jgi:ribosomal peptide maturation radical SAM protein 1
MNVSFVVMPFASAHRPAIGVSLLKAALKQIGISSDIYYFNLDFAELIGISLYDIIAEYELGISSLIGELLFAGSSFNKEANDIKDQIEFELNRKFIDRPSYRNRIFQELMNTHSRIDNFISSCCSKVMSKRSDLIGFTSMFHQNCASVSLAKKIKQEKNVPIIFGGANCEGEMGAALLKAAPWIDFICSGEGDIALAEFVKSYIDKSNKKIHGIITRQSSALDISLTNPVMNMDNLPIPIFEDFFQAINQSQFRHNLSYEMVIETSRGCWWGEKFQCTFCGLNGSTMKYRSKSIRRVLDELKYLIQRYGETKFNVVDNIMDLKYLERLFPEIQNIDVNLFYETKSNLSKKQLSLMKGGGVSVIQPGIESLSDRILNIMKKGVCGLQNIALLKWCMEVGITPLWNIIWGFPGEPVDEYYKMARLVPLLDCLT